MQPQSKFQEFARMVRQEEAGFLLPFVEAALSLKAGQPVRYYPEDAAGAAASEDRALAPNGWEVVAAASITWDAGDFYQLWLQRRNATGSSGPGPKVPWMAP